MSDVKEEEFGKIQRLMRRSFLCDFTKKIMNSDKWINSISQTIDSESIIKMAISGSISHKTVRLFLRENEYFKKRHGLSSRVALITSRTSSAKNKARIYLITETIRKKLYPNNTSIIIYRNEKKEEFVFIHSSTKDIFDRESFVELCIDNSTGDIEVAYISKDLMSETEYIKTFETPFDKFIKRSKKIVKFNAWNQRVGLIGCNIKGGL